MDWMWALGLGSGLLCLLPLLSGLIWLPPRWAFRDSAYGLAAIDLLLIAAKRRDFKPPKIDLDAKIAVPVLFVLISATFALLKALTPVTSFDALVYHLALPDLYLRRGAIVAVPMNLNAGLPANASMLYLWVLCLGDGVSCQILSWSLGMLSAALLLRIGRRLGDIRCGWWAAALFLTTGMVAVACARAGAELLWAFYGCLTLEGLLCISPSPRVLLASGAAAGLALGTRYQAVFLLPAAALIFSRRWGGSGWRNSAAFWLAAAAVGAPWFLKNIIHYHNPVYPFLNGSLLPRAWEIDWPAFLQLCKARTPWNTLATMSGLKDYVRWLGRSSWPCADTVVECQLSLLYWLLLLRLLWVRPTTPMRRGLAVAAAVGIPLSLVSGIMRYHIPTLIPLGLAAGALVPEEADIRSWLARLALTAGLALHFLLAYSTTDNGSGFSALRGQEAAARYLEQPSPGYPAPPFRSWVWLNDHSEPTARVLIVGEERTFYLERDRVAPGIYAREPLSVYIEQAGSAEGLYRSLRSQGFTHIFVSIANAARIWKDPHLDDAKRLLIQGFWRDHLKESFCDRPGGFSFVRIGIVYALVDKPASPGPEFPLDFMQSEARRSRVLGIISRFLAQPRWNRANPAAR